MYSIYIKCKFMGVELLPLCFPFVTNSWKIPAKARKGKANIEQLMKGSWKKWVLLSIYLLLLGFQLFFLFGDGRCSFKQLQMELRQLFSRKI